MTGPGETEVLRVDPVIADLVVKFAQCLAGLVIAGFVLWVGEKWRAGR